jgi:methylglutaconyl-CoA hydratase
MTLVKYDVDNRIGYITLNRPEKRNALSDTMVAQLKETFKKAEEDAEVKVIVLKADGDVFCAGADLQYLQSLQENTYEENLKDSTQLMELFRLIYTLKKVVIAQVNGHAIAGGCGLVSVCDFAFSVPDANFGYSEVRIGFIPAIVMTFLLRKIGESRAKELLLSGNIINAAEARQYGLINWIIEDDEELAKAVKEFALTLCSHNSSQSMELTKKMIARIPSMDLDQALKYAAEMNANARGTEDCKRGISSFLDKRKIEW